MDRTFKAPDAFKKNVQNGMYEVDKANSEIYHLLEALGTPKVYYALKANKYFKDTDSKNEFSDAEIQALELPLPIEIETARRKLIKEANEKGTLANMDEIQKATAPGSINPPKHIRDRLVNNDPIERTINRINRSTLGK